MAQFDKLVTEENWEDYSYRCSPYSACLQYLTATEHFIKELEEIVTKKPDELKEAIEKLIEGRKELISFGYCNLPR